MEMAMGNTGDGLYVSLRGKAKSTSKALLFMDRSPVTPFHSVINQQAKEA
jgi:hypothetical protein